jgi:sodium bicarbonate transporter 10
MIIIRKLLDFLFTQRELKILDDIMPETSRRKEEEEEREFEDNGVSFGIILFYTN